MSTVAGFGTGHCSPGLDMERRWCGMGGSGTGTSSAQPRRIVLGGAWRATARGRTLGRRRFGTEALARAAHAAAPLRGLTARAVAAACTMVPSDACAAHWTRVAGAPRRPGCGTRVGASMGYSAGTRRAPHTRATLSVSVGIILGGRTFRRPIKVLDSSPWPTRSPDQPSHPGGSGGECGGGPRV